MEIDGLNPNSAHVNQLLNLHRKGPNAAEGSDPAPDDEGLSAPASTENESSVEQTAESNDAKGVIRLLLEGHFKGVADIRLKINFFDQLAATEAQQLQAVAGEKVDGILQAVGSVIETLPEEPPDEGPQLPSEFVPEPPIEVPQPPTLFATLTAVPNPLIEQVPQPPLEKPQIPTLFATLTEVTEPPPEQAPEPAVDVLQLEETFTQAVNQVKEDFLADQTPSTDTLLEGIQSAFDQLVESLQTALAPPDTAPDLSLANDEGGLIEPPPESDSAPETPSIIEELKAAFESAMDELIDGFGAVTILSPSSQPAGNGKAYAKFLAIYNEMRDI